jgi:hypothetical protein
LARRIHACVGGKSTHATAQIATAGYAGGKRPLAPWPLAGQPKLTRTLTGRVLPALLIRGAVSANFEASEDPVRPADLAGHKFEVPPRERGVEPSEHRTQSRVNRRPERETGIPLLPLASRYLGARTPGGCTSQC